MEVFGDSCNKEPKIMTIYAVAFLDRTYGHDKFYGYFETKEKAEDWLKKHNKGYGGNLEIAQILVS